MERMADMLRYRERESLGGGADFQYSVGRVAALTRFVILFGLTLGGLSQANGAIPGELAWKSSVPGIGRYNESKISAPEVTADGNILVMAEDGLDPARLVRFGADGILDWQTDSLGSSTLASFHVPAVAQDGTAFLSTDNDKLFVIGKDGSLIRTDFHSGRSFMVEDSDRLITYFSDIFSQTGDIIYSQSFSSQGEYELTQEWIFPLSDFEHGISPFSSPEISTRDGNSYVLLAPYVPAEGAGAGALKSQACVLALSNVGVQRWLWCNDTNSPPMSKIVFDDSGNLYFSTQQRVISLSAEGLTRWSTEITGGAGQPGVASDGTLLVHAMATVGGKKSIYLLNADGSQKAVTEFDYALGLGSGNTIPLFGEDGTSYFTAVFRQYDQERDSQISKSSLVAVSASGEVLWTYESGEEGEPSSPAFNSDESLIYFTVSNHSLHAVRTGNAAAGGAEVCIPAAISSNLTMTFPAIVVSGTRVSASFSFLEQVGDEFRFQLAGTGAPSATSCPATIEGVDLVIPSLAFDGDRHFAKFGISARGENVFGFVPKEFHLLD